MAQHELDPVILRLVEEFPGVPHDAVASIVGDSYRLVVEACGEALVGKAEELARLRLEVRTRAPAATRPRPVTRPTRTSQWKTA
jgi:hypothetical protein